MFEYHGWATVGEYPEEGLEEIISKINYRIKELSWESGVLDLRAVNGAYHLWVAGYSNHKAQESVEIVEFFGYIGKLAPKAYGILYVRDDEDIDGFDNEFQVFLLLRGKLKMRKDPFLSPFIPVVQE